MRYSSQHVPEEAGASAVDAVAARAVAAGWMSENEARGMLKGFKAKIESGALPEEAVSLAAAALFAPVHAEHPPGWQAVQQLEVRVQKMRAVKERKARQEAAKTPRQAAAKAPKKKFFAPAAELLQQLGAGTGHITNKDPRMVAMKAIDMACKKMGPQVGFGRTLAWHRCPPTSHPTCGEMRRIYF
jgi:hypothetical protein